MEGKQNDLDQLAQVVDKLAPPDATMQLRMIDEDSPPFLLLEARRIVGDQQMPYSTEIPTGRIASILLTSDGESDSLVYIGISWATQNLSPWPGGQMAITECVPNRAGYKLLESMASFDIKSRPGSRVLDLGAAPGAWSTLLLRRGLRVTAVAPTSLYPWLMHDPAMTFEPKRAEVYLNECSENFDLIVNDMRLDAQDSARMMVDYAPHLRHGGSAIMTLKLRRKNRRRVMDHAFRLLRRAYKIIHVRQLVSNQREVTLFLRRR